jgi:hypothetical protein
MALKIVRQNCSERDPIYEHDIKPSWAGTQVPSGVKKDDQLNLCKVVLRRMVSAAISGKGAGGRLLSENALVRGDWLGDHDQAVRVARVWPTSYQRQAVI